MSETVKKGRRHWPWVVLAAVVLLIGAPISWRYRPLNQTERSLVGQWQHDEQVLTLAASRRWWAVGGNSDTRGVGGDWSASESSICMSEDIPHSRLKRFPWTSYVRIVLTAKLSRPSDELHWSSQDRVRIQGVEYARIADSNWPAR